jgi:hypothetical protein
MKFNQSYIVNKGQESIVFKEGNGNIIIGVYNDGTLTGTMEGDVLKAKFHNKKTNGAGLIEFTFHENGFEGKWKQGLEPGPMRGKWEGKIATESNSAEGNDSVSNLGNYNLDIFTGLDELQTMMRSLVTESKEARTNFSNELTSFIRKNQEFLWLVPAFLREVQSLEDQIDDEEIEGEIDGFYNKSKFVDELSTKIFTKQCAYYHDRSGLFAWNDEDEKSSIINLIIEDMGISLDDFINSYNAKYKSENQTDFIRFCNILRTVLFSSIVRAYYSEGYDNESIACLMTSPLEDENLHAIEEKTSGFGDSLIWALDDVLHCLNIDVNHEDYDEEWGNYSRNYEQMALDISENESYDFPLIEQNF